ncbi:MAG TPA: DUF6458 family protein [Micromonosporaceae bacterium]|nr:DUF6458 family protein [Micromonosporaceae bacterium]
MGIGASIFLIVVGAILTFATNLHVAGVNMDIIGWILMAGGLLGLIFTALIWGPRRRSTVTTSRQVPGEYRVEERTDI